VMQILVQKALDRAARLLARRVTSSTDTFRMLVMSMQRAELAGTASEEQLERLVAREGPDSLLLLNLETTQKQAGAARIQNRCWRLASMREKEARVATAREAEDRFFDPQRHQRQLAPCHQESNRTDDAWAASVRAYVAGGPEKCR
jgi:hypothetical protein